MYYFFINLLLCDNMLQFIFLGNNCTIQNVVCTDFRLLFRTVIVHNVQPADPEGRWAANVA